MNLDTTAAQNEHARISALMPWVLNRRAAAGEHHAVAAHLVHCADCRAEWQRQQVLYAALQQERQDDLATAVDSEPGLQRLLARIDAHTPMRTAARRRRGPSSRWLLAVAAVQAVCIGGLLYRSHFAPATPYRTLSQPAATVPDGATVHLLVSAQMPVGALQQLLDRADLQIVAGPNATGLMALAPRGTSRHTAASLQVLRADARVRFAEPLDAAP